VVFLKDAANQLSRPANSFPFMLLTVVQQRRDILFCPLLRFAPQLDPYEASQFINFDRETADQAGLLLWQINTELLNGHFIMSGYPVPLRVSVMKLCQQSCNIWLQDFQIILIETTQTRVHGSISISNHCWMVHTVANLKQKLCSRNEPAGTVMEVPEAIWASHPVPSALSPSFETCNISRSYQLVLRLGFENGISKVSHPKLVLRCFFLFLSGCTMANNLHALASSFGTRVPVSC
jgi:hypothetical protein